MKIANIGIIGYGGFGKFLHTHWDRLDKVRVTAVADERIETIQGLDRVRTFSDWRKLLDEKDIDVIAIVTPPDTHKTIANACMEAGKHVLIEKPLSVTEADAKMIIETRDKTGTVAGIDLIMRFNPLLQAIKNFSRNGIFGKLRRVVVENYAQDEQLPPEHWFWNPKISGGILVEHGVHFIDLVHFFSPAKVLAVNGLRHTRNDRQEDQIMANVVYEGGLVATHYHSFSRPGFFEVNKIKLAYDLADIELQGWIPLSGEVKALVNYETKQSLLASPFFQTIESFPVDQIFDESRPEGWGLARNSAPSSRHTVRSGGIQYEVEDLITGKLQTGRSKLSVYAECVQGSLLDVLKKIKDPAHELTAPLEAGLSSLEVAVRASESARRKENV